MGNSEDLQDLLVHSLLHDLKNQAHHLLNGLERITPPKAHENDWRSLRNEARDIGDQLTDALLAIRLNRNQHGLQLESVPIHNLLEDVAETTRARCTAAGIRLHVRPCPELCHFLDMQLLLPTLRSAVDNGCRHARSRVQLAAAVEGAGVLLSVEDDGPGYPDALRNNPEGYITQASPAERRTGLGLLLARLVAEAHRNGDQCGTLRLDTSAELGGACFQLLLP